MTIGSRLALNVFLWAAAIPLLNLGVTWLDRREIVPVSGSIAAGSLVFLLAWAVAIYVWCVPRAADGPKRLGYLLAFLLGMSLIAFGAGWLAFWATVEVFGL